MSLTTPLLPGQAALAVGQSYKIWSASCLSLPLTNCLRSFRMLWPGFRTLEKRAERYGLATSCRKRKEAL